MNEKLHVMNANGKNLNGIDGFEKMNKIMREME